MMTTSLCNSVLLLLATLHGGADALAASVTARPATTTPATTVYQGLQTTPLVRASGDGFSTTTLPSLWRADTPLGVADEKVLPACKKIFFVGVGTGQAAAQFAEQLNIDPSLCFGDEDGVAGDVLALEKGFPTMWNPPAVNAMMARNDETSLKTLGEAYKSAADTIGIQNLAPKKIKDTLRQGGTFVFKGRNLLLEHYDQKVGDNAAIEDIVEALK